MVNVMTLLGRKQKFQNKSIYQNQTRQIKKNYIVQIRIRIFKIYINLNKIKVMKILELN